MSEATWLIVIGLGFDIIGAIFIVGPLLNLVNRTWGRMNPEKELLGNDMKGMFRDDKRIQKLAWIGIILLSIGFAMQILGNWLQNPPL